MTKLKDICLKIGSGATPTGGKSAYLSEGISLIRSQNVLDLAFTLDGLAYINEDQAMILNNVDVQKGDILLNITGDSVARVCIVPNNVLPARVNQHVAIIRVDRDKADNNYVLYSLIKSKKSLLSLAGGGATRKALTKKMIEEFNIELPQLSIQKKISAHLSEIDSKISINRRICENLEAQAQALFKHWFIDFAPFKDGQFVDSELGMIPEGWRVGTLGEIADLIKPSIKPQDNVEYSHYSIPAFDNNQIPSRDKGETIKSNKFAIQDTVTLLSKLNPDHKRIWFVSKVGTNAICSTEFLPFYAKDREHSSFVYCYLSSWRNYREIANGAKGTTNSHQRIDANAILSRKLAFDKEAITMFCNLVGDLLKLKNKAAQESLRLSTLRDTLLPKLMSGQIKV